MSKAIKKSKLKEDFEGLCELYLRIFCNKQELEYEENAWIGRVGEVAMIGDYFINFHDLRYDIDNDVPKGVYFEWYDYDTRCAMAECTRKINYPSWAKGAPKPYTEAELQKIETMRNDIDEATRKFHEYLKENGF